MHLEVHNPPTYRLKQQTSWDNKSFTVGVYGSHVRDKQLSGIPVKHYNSGTIPEILGHLEPMFVQAGCIYPSQPHLQNLFIGVQIGRHFARSAEKHPALVLVSDE